MISNERPITEADFTAALERAVEENGEHYTYPGTEKKVHFGSGFTGPSCSYVHNGKPSCLIGKAMHNLGFTVDKLAEYEGEGASYLLRRLAPELPQRVGSAADYAQGLQDEGGTWGAALREYREHI